MTEIPQYGICCLATAKLKVRFKNYFALGCSCLPFGFWVNRSLQFNNTWPAHRQKHLETLPSRRLYARTRVSQSRVCITHTYRELWRSEEWTGWDGFLKLSHVLSQGMGPAPSLTLPHSNILMKHPRAPLLALCCRRETSPSHGAWGVTRVRGAWLLPISCLGSRPVPCRSARIPLLSHVPWDSRWIWIGQPEFFYVLLLLPSTDCQLNRGFQLLEPASNTNKKRSLCFLTECSVAGHWESQRLSSIRPLHPYHFSE